MRALHSFIVEPVNNRRYNNILEFEKADFVTSVSEEDHTVSNRFAKVVSLPLYYEGEIEIGDILLVHHNVFKFYNDMYGRRKSGKSYFKDNLFFIEDDQYFLYNHNKKWTAPGKYCFIKPLEVKDSFLKKSGKYEPLQGTIKYSNKQLERQREKEKDIVVFKPDSEYEFKVDGEILYRMFTNNITTILNE